MSLSTYLLEYGRHVGQLRRRRRRRAYAPTSNTASHENHEKIHSWVSFSFPYEYGAPLGGPSGRRSSATNVCRNCGTVNSYDTASEYVDFHENKFKIVKKSVYQRKYHLDNVLNDIISKNGWQLSVRNRKRIHDIFRKIDRIMPQINGNRKRMININFILKKIFEFLNLPSDNISITRSKKTLLVYEYYRNEIINLIQL